VFHLRSSSKKCSGADLPNFSASFHHGREQVEIVFAVMLTGRVTTVSVEHTVNALPTAPIEQSPLSLHTRVQANSSVAQRLAAGWQLASSTGHEHTSPVPQAALVVQAVVL
jgi:hypothetical protein